MNRIKIMLVDDEEGFLQAMKKRLEKRDFKVITAISGNWALKNLEANKDTDVVILDIKMPGMDGIETLKEIKTKYPLIEVIMLTGHATIESAIDGMKLGAFDYLLKPCALETLIKKVEESVNKKREHEKKILDATAKEALFKHGLG